MTPSQAANANARLSHCAGCGSPVVARLSALMDGARPYCEACDPTTHIRIPRINLWERPEGQEIARWTDVQL